MEKITSKSNTIIKDTNRLFTSSKARNENHLFALEGARLCFDVLNSVYEADTLLYTEDIYSRYPDEIDALAKKSDRVYVITNDVAQKLTQTKSAQGVFLTVKAKDEQKNFNCGKIIALDNVQDPANVGAIIRSAEALGIDGIVAYNCCDVFNPKTLRASMGSILRMSICVTDDLEQTLSQMKSSGFKVYSTVPSTQATKITDVDSVTIPCALSATRQTAWRKISRRLVMTLSQSPCLAGQKALTQALRHQLQCGRCFDE